MPPSAARAAICAARISSVLTSPPSSSPAISSAESTCLQLRRRLAGLGRMRLVGNHGEALALRRRQLAHGLEREGERLNGADDDLLSRASAVASWPLLLPVSLLMVATTPCVRSKPRARPATARQSHCDRTRRSPSRTAFVLGVVQVGEEMRGPGDRIRLSRSGRMLDQIFAARAFLPHRGDELSRRVELVIAGEDELGDLLLLVLLGDDVAAEDFQPAFPLPNLFPEIAGAVRRSGSADCPSPPWSPLLNGRKDRRRAVEPSSS